MKDRVFGHRRTRAAGSVGHSNEAFTLIELMVSMAILLLLAALTMTLLNATLDSDRIRTGSRELQSYLAGARDRAIYSGQPRGVRLLPDPNDFSTVNSFVYVGVPPDFKDGTVTLSDNGVGKPSTIVHRPPPPAPVTTPSPWGGITGLPSGAPNGFRERGMLPDGCRIQIPAKTGLWYTVAFDTTNNQWMLTTRPGLSFGTAFTFDLQLAPAVLPGEQPRSLPQRIAIDLNGSVLPASWGPSFNPATAPANPLDVIFSPEGTVIGAAASDGRIHFVLADTADTNGQTPTANLSARNRLNALWQPNQSYVAGNVIVPHPWTSIAYRCIVPGPVTTGAAASEPAWPDLPNQQVGDAVANMWQSFVKKANFVVSVAAQTGRVTTHPVNVAQPAPVDTFLFAENGEVTQ